MMLRLCRSIVILLMAVVLPNISMASAKTASELVNLLNEGGHIALMRHALAPGTGDPTDVVIGDCSTQRNLSDTGRRQAKAAGEYLKSLGLDDAVVYTSQWCRCRETAALLGFGVPIDFSALNSFFELRQNEAPQMRELRRWLRSETLERPVILVTHQVVITALTGAFTSSGEIVVVRKSENGSVELVGAIPPGQ